MEVFGLIFDGDDVLYDSTMWRRWLLQLLGRIGLHTHYDAFFRVWEREYLNEVNQGRRDYWDALRTFLLASGLSRGQIDEVVGASLARYRQLRDTARPLPGVLSTIHQLHGIGVRLAVLNNSHFPAKQITGLLKRLGLGGQFRCVLSSFDLKCVKPSPTSYASALAKLELPPDDVAFVGHDSVELNGAAAVGMRTIAVNHGADAKADVHLDKFDDLLSAIQLRTHRRLAG